MASLVFEIELDNINRMVKYRPTGSVEEWKTFTIYDVAATTLNNSISGHLESKKAVDESLPFTLKTLPSYLLEGRGNGAVDKAVFDIVGEEVEWSINIEGKTVDYLGMSPDETTVNGVIGSWTNPNRNVYGKDPLSVFITHLNKLGVTTEGASCKRITDKKFVCTAKGAESTIPFIPTVTPSGGILSIPISTVAAQVVTNAIAGSPNSKLAVSVTAPFKMPLPPVDGVTAYPLTISSRKPLEEVTVNVVPLDIIKK